MAMRWVGTAAAWAIAVLLLVVPLVVLAIQALATGWFFPQVVPDQVGFGTLEGIVADPVTRSALGEGAAVSALAVLVSLAIAIPAARALALGRIRHRRAVGLALIVPIVMPPLALAMGLNVALIRAGLAGTLAAVVLAHQVATLPYAILVLAALLARYDVRHEQQARSLGAGPARVITHVFLPLAAPALIVTGAITFVVSWSQYLLTLLPGAGDVITPPILVLAASSGGNPAATAAIALVTAIPPALAVLLALRMMNTPPRWVGAPA
jgi:putative spermidine/putrescine transport system permease protein